MITHRYEGILKHKISIRYCKKYKNWDVQGDYETWRLFKKELNDDYGSYYLSHITPIEYCPFCGIRLED